MTKKSNMELAYTYSLTVEEASQFFGIGHNKIREIIKNNPYANYLLWSGNRVKIKREKFTEFLDTSVAV